MNRLLTRLGPEDWEKPLYYVSLGIAPMRFRPAIRLGELVIHGWDIRSRLAPDAHLTAESLPVLVDIILGPLLAPPSWLFVPGPRLPAPLRYRWALTGAGAREQDIVIDGETTAHLTKAWSRRLPASAALPLSGAAQAQRWASRVICQ